MLRLATIRGRAARHAGADGWTYFVFGAGKVKIGVTTGPPSQRVAQMCSSSPVLLELLAVEPGTIQEGELHERFRHLHSHGEWFHVDVELLVHIACLRVVYGVPDAIYGVPENLLRAGMQSALGEVATA